jgi:hypothetical protein
LALNADVRLDYNEHSGTKWVPEAGLSYIDTKSTVLKAIVYGGISVKF